MYVCMIAAVFLYLCSGLGITAGAHRLWSHKSYKAKVPLRLILTFFNTIAFQVKYEQSCLLTVVLVNNWFANKKLFFIFVKHVQKISGSWIQRRKNRIQDLVRTMGRITSFPFVRILFIFFVFQRLNSLHE